MTNIQPRKPIEPRDEIKPKEHLAREILNVLLPSHDGSHSYPFSQFLLAGAVNETANAPFYEYVLRNLLRVQAGLHLEVGSSKSENRSAEFITELSKLVSHHAQMARRQMQLDNMESPNDEHSNRLKQATREQYEKFQLIQGLVDRLGQQLIGTGPAMVATGE